ncbi:hypothetical protein ROZALSC1DRAFT_24844 [Rozella allomycis CSF55]|uniref:Uncharacterized protein n=1 Tax=Rozella allomycis (strain CSF55) TaxID=988480 RepID=A0A4P9YCD3_ROZAC|nr:hypothetical protein ROZALSC1DRAFT_24844 [Rozella allomycis CSF55]
MYLEAFVDEKKVGFTGQLNVPEKEFYSLTLKSGTNRIVFSDPSNELADMAFAFYKSDDLVVPGEFGSLDTPELPLFAVVLDGKKRLVESHGLFSKDKIISLSDSTINVYLGAELVCKELSKEDVCHLPEVNDFKTVKICKGKAACVGYEIYPSNENLFEIDIFTLRVRVEVEEFLKNRNFRLKNVDTIIPYKEYQTARSSTKVLGLFNEATYFSVLSPNIMTTTLDDNVELKWMVEDLGLSVKNSYLVESFIKIIPKCPKDQEDIEVDWILRSHNVDNEDIVLKNNPCFVNANLFLRDKSYNQVGLKYKDKESSFYHFNVVDFLIIDVIFPRQSNMLIGERVRLSVISSFANPEFYGTLFLDDRRVEMDGFSSQRLNLPNFSFQNVKVYSLSGKLLFERFYKTPITIHPFDVTANFFFSGQQDNSKNPIFFLDENVELQVVSPLNVLDYTFQVIQSNEVLESKASFNRKIMLNTSMVGTFDVAVKIGETNHIINQIEVVDFSSFFTKKDHFVHEKIVIQPVEKICNKRPSIHATMTYLDNAHEVVQKVDLCKTIIIDINVMSIVRVTFKTDFGSFERVLNVIENQKGDVEENDETKSSPSALLISLLSVAGVIAAVGGFLAYRAKASKNGTGKY